MSEPETRGFPELKHVPYPRNSSGSPPPSAACRTSPCRSTRTAIPGSTATKDLEQVCDALERFQVPDGHAPAGRAPTLPGLGSPLLPPWTLTSYGEDGVTMEGQFTRYHVGGNMAVHGGVIPLFYDWHFGMIVSAAGRPISRTAYLHVDYRAVTPIDQPLISRGRIDRIDGRKAFITATMTDAEGTVLSEANGLMIKLLPHQP